MQWLIDLVIEKIGVPPCFYDRGDPAAWDFTWINLNTDGAWHDLDLSAIVPNAAKAVLLRIRVQCGVVAKLLQFRKSGNVNSLNTNGFRVQVANVVFEGDLVCACTNGHIEYRTNIIAPTKLADILVKGWWK